jgi:hypothetical protein
MASIRIVLLALFFPVLASAQAEIQGAWHPEIYRLADGTVREVTGLIFFTDRDWTVLFFTREPDGSLARGAGEGGTYTLAGDRLTFTHLYRLSGGRSTPLQMFVNSEDKAEKEPCRIELSGEGLEIHFPSGNRMTFRRSSS